MADLTILDLTATDAATITDKTTHMLGLEIESATTPRKLSLDELNKELFDSTHELTIAAGTVTDSTPVLNLTQTWNDGTEAMTALKLNVTDTASAAASLLMDLQVGSTSVTNISKAGLYGLPNAGQFNPRTNAAGYASLHWNGSQVISFNGFVVTLLSSHNVNWNSDTMLIRDAANTLALRNATAAQAFHLYNTYTSGSVYERGFMRWASNVLEIGTEHVGASARDLQLKTGGTARLTINAAGSLLTVTPNVVISSGNYMGVNTDSCLVFSTSNMQLRGSGGVAVLLDCDNNSTSESFVVQTNSTSLGSGTELFRIAEGGLVSFGGTTSSFPAIKRSTTILQARLADDSAFATLQGKLQTDANAVSESITPTHTLTLYDAAGTAYKVAVQAA